ncbi:Gfo/Idh/MocA family protein [Nocardioides marmoribigeumensis]|uniref:Dehydrogenase n=1 Tax=Nocardioides marmoribigeumensis TaxID=433649 RepID=A0ABU2BU68_9ACTN|nr:Gfo/Idh/MocA family oxidoreductase [Nocardioides marmoribigeumensis]MDR7361821.1 putative dehydrogenase [Nocardioides marmoribigeumensis]
MVAPLRVGVLGAAKIAPKALLAPALLHPDVEVTAVAARDEATARAYAERHGIPRVLPDYEALVGDPDLDVVYNPLPMALHGRWTKAALGAGKHVLCEKPFTANGDEAAEVVAVAERTGLVVMEAFHHRYHPLVERLVELLERREIGELRSVDAWFRARINRPDDIRWKLELAGGSLMDIGTYPLHLMRTVAGEPEVVSAEAIERTPAVDRTMLAHLRFTDGPFHRGTVEGRMASAMLSRRGRGSGALVVGTQGSIRVEGFVQPTVHNRIEVVSPRGRRAKSFPRTPTTYDGQLAAFVRAVREGAPVPTDGADAVAQMRAIDAIYTAAGLPLRQPA